ncbi:MAG: guanylate kinase [Thermodesulfobacteriota bacterium]
MMTIFQQPDKNASGQSGPHRRGRLFIVSAPSAAGKTTLCAGLLERLPDMVRSVSYTTRAPRPGEQNGVDYYFIDEKQFRAGIDTNRWVEWARVHGNYYGTAADAIEEKLSAGIDMVLNIDVQGADQIHARYPDSVRIFILPPSLEELRRRLETRGGDDPAAMDVRMAAAQQEMARRHDFDHVIVNDDLDTAIDQLIAVVAGYRSS